MGHFILNLALLVASILLLWKGADWLVESAARIGHHFNISDLVIGLTVVAFGTSAPEFAVTVSAAISGKADISVGNVVGSNIFNLGFILGGCALFRALPVKRISVYRDGSLLVITSLTLVLMLSDHHLSHLEGAILFCGLIGYLALLILQKKAEPSEVPKGKATWKDPLLLLLGIATVAGGGDLLVKSASELARLLGLSEWLIAVTIVAAGTSAPELATSLTAAAKGLHGMSLGNLIGSDLFNLLGVLGLAGLIRNLHVDTHSLSSIYMLMGMCVLVVIFMRSGWKISRREGLALVLLGVLRWILDFVC